MKRRKFPEPNLRSMTDRHGKRRWLYRTPQRDYFGGSTTEPYRSPRWLAWYTAAAAAAAGCAPSGEGAGAYRTVPHTIGALVAKYYQQPEWKTFEPATVKSKRHIIERIRERHGGKRVETMKRRHVKEILAAMATTPDMANRYLQNLRTLMQLALDLEWIETDPTQGVKKLTVKSDGFHTWTEEEIDTFERRWPVGSRERLAMALMLYTAQRRSDAITMGRQHVTQETISVKQAKGGTRLELPIHPRLREIIDAMPSEHLTFLTTQHGAPYTAAGFGNWFRTACDAAGLPQCAAHGLRKAASRRLAEAGCTPHEIMSITGHKSLKEVDTYTRAVSQERMARGAMARIGGDETGTNRAKLQD